MICDEESDKTVVRNKKQGPIFGNCLGFLELRKAQLAKLDIYLSLFYNCEPIFLNYICKFVLIIDKM